MCPCFLTRFKEALFPLLAGLTKVNCLQDVVRLLLLLKELDSPGFKRRPGPAVCSVLRMVLTRKVAVLLLELLLSLGNVTFESLGSLGDENAGGRVGLLLKLLCVSGGEVQEVGVDCGQVDQGRQGIRCGFTCEAGGVLHQRGILGPVFMSTHLLWLQGPEQELEACLQCE